MSGSAAIGCELLSLQMARRCGVFTRVDDFAVRLAIRVDAADAACRSAAVTPALGRFLLPWIERSEDGQLGRIGGNFGVAAEIIENIGNQENIASLRKN